MATRRWSVNPEDNDHGVTDAAGAAVVTKNIELTVDVDALVAAGITGPQLREQIALGCEKITAYIESQGKFNLPA